MSGVARPPPLLYRHHMSESRNAAQRQIAQGIAAWDRGDYTEALEVFDEVVRGHPRFPDVHNKRGLCLALLGRPREAEVAFGEAIKLSATYAEAHLNRGIVLQELGEHDAAYEAFGEASRLDHRDGGAYPSDVGNQLAVTHAKLGDLYLVADQPQLAADQYAQALEVRPRFLDVRTKLAEALIDVGDLTRAREELEFVLENNPNFTGARLRLGVVLNRTGDRDGAIEEWELCALSGSKDLRARAYLASVGVTEMGRSKADRATPQASELPGE